MRYLLAVFCCLAIPVLVPAQSKRTDFDTQISLAKNDSQKAIIYRQALVHYYNRKPDSLKIYADKGIEYFRTRKNLVGEGIIIAQLALFDRTEGRMNICLQRLNYALDIFRKEKYLPGIADVLGNIGSVEGSKGNYDIAARYITESMKMEEEAGKFHGVMVGYMNLASMYLQQSDTVKTAQYIDKALEVSKKLPCMQLRATMKTRWHVFSTASNSQVIRPLWVRV